MKPTSPKKHKDRPYLRKDARNGKLVDTGKHHCRSRNCRGIVDKKAEHSPFCAKCRSRRWKDTHPLHYSFHHLRNRAKERGKDFTLTREQYIDFAVRTDYARLKGKTSLSLSIDRIDNSHGYHHWNIQAITLRENSRKQFVPFFANQIENQSYEPTADELAAVEQQLTEQSNEN